ncbi:MAG: class I SAM-dependent methyltransferase [Methanosarcinaceae archaeon]|nr:class I SAM-dependent methyltransferase [Methanosarcinaceae archaeon]
MDMWKFYDITHRNHVNCNPTSVEKLGHLVELLRLPLGAHVIDIACGKGEFLIRLVEAYGVNCLGIDLSPFFIAEARNRLEVQAPEAEVTFMEMDGAEFEPKELNSFTVASCLGASWIYGGHAGTLDALTKMVAPGGWVITGEPYWLQDPCEEHLKVLGHPREAFGTHLDNVEAGEERGLDLVHTIVSNVDDWDRYEGLQWAASDEYARSHPEDPDLPELVRRVGEEKAAYLRWGRDTLGWAIYVLRRKST